VHDDVSRAISLFMAFHILSSFFPTPPIGENLLRFSGGNLRFQFIGSGTKGEHKFKRKRRKFCLNLLFASFFEIFNARDGKRQNFPHIQRAQKQIPYLRFIVHNHMVED
jgi:hypothetical protein